MGVVNERILRKMFIEEGKTADKIALELNVPRFTVQRALNRYKIRRKTKEPEYFEKI